jgi:DNA gyrase inhibitor GyrI
MIGISHDDPHVTDESKFRYDACADARRAPRATFVSSARSSPHGAGTVS